MSFDVFFSPARYGMDLVEQVNPFTKEKMRAAKSAPLPPDRVRAVRALFAAHGASEPDPFGCYVVTFRDGTQTEVFGEDLENGCMVALRGMSDDCVMFLYELLLAGDWVAIPSAGDEPCALAPSEACVTNAPEGFPRPLVVGSAGEMRAALTGGFTAWRTFRDKVVGPR